MVLDRKAPFFLTPFPVDAFESNYLGKAILAIHRNNSSHFSDTVSLSHIDELVTSVRIPSTNFNLAQGDAPLPLEDYCIGDTYVQKSRVLALHKQGATIILRSIEQWSSNLNRLRMIAEDFFGCECQVNVYITPPGRKSTPPHWDTHDLVVMQIAGSKSWRLFKGERTLPLPNERFNIGKDYVSSEYEEVLLCAGDTLYLPRGIIHEPVAETYSVHVSIGVLTLRWYDVMEVALRLLASGEGSPLRTSISNKSQQMTCNQVLKEIQKLLDHDIHAKAIEILHHRFENNSRTVDYQGAMLDSFKEL